MTADSKNPAGKKPGRKWYIDLRKDEVLEALDNHDHSIKAAAEELNTHRKTLTAFLDDANWYEREPLARGRKTKKDLRDEQVKKALQQNRGVVAKAARELGCTRQVLASFLEGRPTLQRVATQEREGVKDLLESTAWKLALGVEDPNDEDKWKVKPDGRLLEKLLASFVQDRGYYTGPQFGQGNPDQKIVINIGGRFVEEDDKDIEVEHSPIDEIEPSAE